MKLKIILTNIILLFILAPSSYSQSKKYGYDASRTNQNALPGSDFYNFACGKWIENLPDKPDFPYYDNFTILQEQNERRIQLMIEEASKLNAPKGSIEQLIGDYYSIFMDSTRRNREGAEPLKPYLNMVKAIKDRNQLIEVAARLQRNGINNMFMNVGIQPDMTNSSENIVNISQGGLTLIKSERYTNDDTSALRVRYIYHKYIENVFRLAGYSEKEAFVKTQDVNYIEHKIAQENTSFSQMRDLSLNLNKTVADSMMAQYPGINWSRYFKALGYNGVKDINVAQPQAIRHVSELIAKENINRLKSYMEFKVIASGAGYLSDDFVRENFMLNQSLSGIKSDKPRWRKAIGEINSKTGMIAGKLFVEKYFPEECKNNVTVMYQNIKEMLKNRIQNLKWLGDSTKARALEKLDNIRLKIGYPSAWPDYSGLVIDKQLSLYENALSINRFLFDQEIANKLNKPINKDEWVVTPQTINAFYNVHANEIIVTAAMLQAPFYDPNADDACNYGGIGTIIGHELTHGFDDQGRNFDKFGNFRKWWTSDDSNEFRARSNRMRDYFSGMEALPGKFVNGKITLGENIADHGGLKVAYMAYTEHLKKHPSDVADGFTPEQRFFLQYAFINAGTTREKEAERQLAFDKHAPQKLRVNGQLPLLQFWYDAFKISKKSKLYIPQNNRVDIW